VQIDVFLLFLSSAFLVIIPQSRFTPLCSSVALLLCPIAASVVLISYCATYISGSRRNEFL